MTVSTTDKREYKAKLVGACYSTAPTRPVLKIDGHSLPTVSLGNPSLLKPGEWAVAIGCHLVLTIRHCRHCRPRAASCRATPMYRLSRPMWR